MLSLADIYVASDASTAEDIRASIRSLPEIRSYIYTLIGEQKWTIQDERDAGQIDRLIALVSIEDNGNDPVAQSALSFLYYSAETAGIDMRPALDKVAALSSDAPRGPQRVSTKRFLESFYPTKVW
jgi:hypothetical protein